MENRGREKGWCRVFYWLHVGGFEGERMAEVNGVDNALERS